MRGLLVSAIVLSSVTARADDAHLSFGRPHKVNVLRAGKGSWNPLAQGDVISVGDQVATLRDQIGSMAFPDGTQVQLGSEAWINIINTKPDAVELVDGLLHSEGPIRIHAGDSDTVLTVEAWTRFDKKSGRLFVAVLAGKADVVAKGQRTTVLLGSGLALAKGTAPGKPTPLLKKPSWTAPGFTETLVTTGDPVLPDLGWAAVDGAAHYRFELAKDEAVDDHLTDTIVDAPGAPPTALAPGAYTARVTPLGAAGDPGVPALRHVQVVALGVKGGSMNGGVLTGIGKIEVTLGDTGAPLTLTIDGQPAASPALVGPGAHEIAILAKPGSPPLKTISAKITTPRARVELAPQGRAYLATITLVDELGAPLAAEDSPALTLEGREGAACDAPSYDADAHVWHASVTPFVGANRRVASIVAKWDGQPIGDAEQHVEIVSPVDAHTSSMAVPVATNVPIPVAIEDPLGQPGSVEGAPIPSPWRWYGVAVALRMQSQLVGPTTDTIGPRLALDASFAFKRTALFASISGATEPTSASGLDVGVRQQLAHRWLPQHPLRLDLDASLDVSAPLSGPSSTLRLRPLLELGIGFAPIWIATAQGLTVAPTNGGGTDEAAYTADLVAGVRLGEQVALIAAIDILAGKLASEPGKDMSVAIAAGAGMRVRIAPVELVASVRDGIHGAGEDLWGRLSLVLSVEYRR